MINYQVVENDGTGRKTVIAFFPNEDDPLQSTTSDHPHFSSIVRGLEANDESVYGLFDIQSGINRKFEDVSSRYAVRNGVFYRDLDPMHNALSDQIIRFMDEGIDDWKPLVRFLERVDANPSEQSREQLMNWIAAEALTITDDGMVVGYKAVEKAGSKYRSVQSGPGVVNGVEYKNAKLPNQPGDVVEIPRSKVDSDPSNHCSVGLHVGTWSYAEWFKGRHTDRVILEVQFDPAHAVSVPADHGAKKIRVWRYMVVGLKDSAYTGAVRPLGDYYTNAEAQASEEYYDDPDAEDNF